MTWQWVVLIIVAAGYALCAQAIHAWKEVRITYAIPEDVRREMAERSGK